MKNSLLVCIAFHYDKNRLKWLHQVIDNFLSYECPVTIFIDTNVEDLDLKKPVVVHSHTDMTHPFHLTWFHRKHIKNNIDKYDNFMYVEDDMLVPYEHYENYLRSFRVLWPQYVPSFIRIEEKEGEQFVTDITRKQDANIIHIDNRKFVSLEQPYHAFWIMPAKELKETMTRIFVRLHDSREHASSYLMWEMNKTPLVEVYHDGEKYQIAKECYSFHLPNNYALSKDNPHAKINPENIFNS